MPMLNSDGNVYYIPGVKPLRFFFPFTIIALSGKADENLSAAFISVMNVPIVSAARFKRYVENTDLLSGNGSQIALFDKILCESVVRRSDREYHFCGMLGFYAFGSGFIFPHVFCKAKNRPRFRPAHIKRRMRACLVSRRAHLTCVFSVTLRQFFLSVGERFPLRKT